MSTKLSFLFRLFQVAALACFSGLALPVVQAQMSDKGRPLFPQMILPRVPEALAPAKLTAMDVSARIVGLNAEVTTTLTFFNPNKRVLEGDLEFPLPDGAGVTGYALDIKGRMVDGVIVKKEKARIAFETEVKRGVDPGLVEHVAGNVFRTRVYPLPANGERKVRVTYVTRLAVDAKGDAAWHLPMPLGETIARLGIDVEVTQGAVKPEIGGFGNLRFETLENIWVAKTEIQDAKPGEDLWVALPKLPPQVTSVEKTKEGDVYFLVSDLVPVDAAPMAAKAPAHLGLAWDASGSREGDKAKEIAMLKKLLAAWPDTGVTLLVFRDRAEEPQVFGAADREALFKALDDLAYDGGTDLSVVPGAMAKAENIDQWLLFTDGLDTLSGQVPDFGKQRITAVVNETVADRELLDQVCAAGGGQVVDLQSLDAGAAADSVLNPPLRLATVHGDGVADLQGVGQVVHGRAVICGKLTGDEAELTLEYSTGKHSAPVKIGKAGATDGNLLATVWAGRRINQLSVRPDDNEDELLALGRKYGIVSPVTSLIVLETLDQYVHNEIEPPASLPDLRNQWAETMETRAKAKTKSREEKLERLVAMWNARLQWWEQDFPAARKNNGDGVGGGVGEGQGQGDDQPNGVHLPAAPPTGAPAPEAIREMAASQTQLRRVAPAVTDGSSTLDNGAASGTLSGSNSYSGSTTVNSGVVLSGNGAWAAGSAGAVGNFAAFGTKGAGESPSLTIAIKPWNPATPYLAAIKAAQKGDRYAVYLKQRKENKMSPAFFLDCADYFYSQGEKDLGGRILTNLAEMKLEDPPLLRVLAWRFEQAGEMDRAIVVLRRVYKMRPDESQSLRDLALALTERGKASAKEAGKTADLTEALALEEKLLFGDWTRNDEIELPTLEEMNALIAWVHTEKWDKSPVIPNLDERLLKNMDDDVRIVMCWDADSTDIDLHVVEPTGEEAFYNHNRTVSGGLVSHDVTQSYGPEEYIMRRGLQGNYRIFAQYYGSTQQAVTGPVTVTATVFTNFGRPDEKKQVLTLRLDKVKENVPIGDVHFDAAKDEKGTGAAGGQRPGISRNDFRSLKTGQTQQETLKLLGEPDAKKDGEWTYEVGTKHYCVQFSKDGTVRSVIESLPGNAKVVLVQ